MYKILGSSVGLGISARARRVEVTSRQQSSISDVLYSGLKPYFFFAWKMFMGLDSPAQYYCCLRFIGSWVSLLFVIQSNVFIGSWVQSPWTVEMHDPYDLP